jgi:hypothetical protein
VPGSGAVPPEVVQSVKVEISDGIKVLTVANTSGRYVLSCNLEALGCVTPEPNKKYLLITKETRWRFPGATEDISLKFLQDFTVTYNKGENVGLIPHPDNSAGTGPGMFLLRSWTGSQK